MIDWSHIAVESLAASIPVILYMAANKHSAKKENEMRHAENKSRLDNLMEGQKYLKPHDHIEEAGALQAEGIMRRKNGE